MSKERLRGAIAMMSLIACACAGETITHERPTVIETTEYAAEEVTVPQMSIAKEELLSLSTDMSEESEDESSEDVYEQPPVYETENFGFLTDMNYTDDELYIVGCVVQGEYPDGTEEDKRLVACCIFNRVDSDLFPNTIYEVCTAKGQFHSAGFATLETMNAVYKEAQERTDARILYFNNAPYMGNHPLLYQVNGHWFFEQ